MSYQRIAEVLRQVATLLELKGDNPFKIRSYQRAAQALEDASNHALLHTHQVARIPGIGKSLAEHIETLRLTGELPLLHSLQESFPQSLFSLFEIEGLGAKKIRSLYENLDIDSIPSLKKACQQQRIATLRGWGKASEEKLLTAITHYESHKGMLRMDEALSIALPLRERLFEHDACLEVCLAGSLRRSKEILHDIDFLASTRSPQILGHFFASQPEVQTIIAEGLTKVSVRLKSGISCDLRLVEPEAFPFALLHFTGSKEHNTSLRALAIEKGFKLNEYGLFSKETQQSIPLTSEEEIYQALGLFFIPPELREGHHVIEQAQQKPFPPLLTHHNLKGTFHCHTTASDGQHSLEEMAKEARNLGLTYLGIADHSPAMVQANGLSSSQLLQQIKHIKELNEQWDDFTLLAGSEVDILQDGSLDYDDTILAQLDYCVASIHTSFQLDKKKQTQRIIAAMENPHVTMIGHLTGRLLLKRHGYELDMEAILNCAAQTRTVIEINANPKRLDMDWRYWQRARDLGVLASINPDAHHLSHFSYLSFGSRIARKGGLSPSHVLNTRPIEHIRTFLQTPKWQRS